MSHACCLHPMSLHPGARGALWTAATSLRDPARHQRIWLQPAQWAGAAGTVHQSCGWRLSSRKGRPAAQRQDSRGKVRAYGLYLSNIKHFYLLGTKNIIWLVLLVWKKFENFWKRCQIVTKCFVIHEKQLIMSLSSSLKISLHCILISLPYFRSIQPPLFFFVVG